MLYNRNWFKRSKVFFLKSFAFELGIVSRLTLAKRFPRYEQKTTWQSKNNLNPFVSKVFYVDSLLSCVVSYNEINLSRESTYNSRTWVSSGNLSPISSFISENEDRHVKRNVWKRNVLESVQKDQKVTFVNMRTELVFPISRIPTITFRVLTRLGNFKSKVESFVRKI